MQEAESATALYHLVHRLGKVFRTIDAASGIPPAQLSALLTITMHGPMPLSTLAAYELVKPQSVSRVIDDLVERRLVRRRADATDRRKALVEPTERGRRIALTAREQKIEFLAQYLQQRSAGARTAVERAVAVLEPILEDPT